MKQKGLSLIELIVTTIVLAIVSLAISVYFVNEYKFRKSMKERIEISREARLAVNHLTRVLRFAIANTVSNNPPQLNADIEGGHLNFILSDTSIRYMYNAGQNTLSYQQPVGDENEVKIAENITSFTPVWNPAEKEIEIELVVGEGINSVTVETKIRTLGE